MLSNLHISNFRSFRELHVPRLSRVNLFVGPNNAGKTSILEAAEILTSGKVLALWLGPQRRGEWSGSAQNLEHLFLGHELQPGTSFRLWSDAKPARQVTCEVLLADDLQPLVIESRRKRSFMEDASGPPLKIRYSSHLIPTPVELTLPSEGGPPSVPRSAFQVEGSPAVQYLGIESFDLRSLSLLWNGIVLTPDEDRVVEALQIIEPKIERIAFSAEDEPAVFLRIRGTDQRIPLGSAGDGIRRLLALSLHLNSAQDGFLLVDEIDTGLHRSVMTAMWRMVIETAQRLNIQVLTTTHSLDCVRALGDLHDCDPALASNVALHRLESDLVQTVRYSSEDLSIAAQHHMDVR